MQYISDNEPCRGNDAHRNGHRASFNDTPQLLLGFPCQCQSLQCKKNQIGQQQQQHVVVVDGFGESAMHECVEKPLHAASWTIPPRQDMEYAFGCK